MINQLWKKFNEKVRKLEKDLRTMKLCNNHLRRFESCVNKNAQTTCSFSLFNSFSFSLAIQQKILFRKKRRNRKRTKLLNFLCSLFFWVFFNMHLVNFLHHLKCTRGFAHNFFDVLISFWVFFLWYSQHNDVDNHDNGTKIFERGLEWCEIAFNLFFAFYKTSFSFVVCWAVMMRAKKLRWIRCGTFCKLSNVRLSKNW